MPAAKCESCGGWVARQHFPLCPNCRLFVIDETELELSKDAPVGKLYRDDDGTDSSKQ